MAKRRRATSGWAYPSVDNITHFVLDINSIENYDSSAVEFDYNIGDKAGPLYHNGKLNLRASNDWSVALSNFCIPNNFETYPSIDKNTNLSAAFVSMQIYTHYVYAEDDYFYTIKFPVKHFPHENYSAKDTLNTLNRLIDESLISIVKDEESNIVTEFRKSVANFYIDIESNFVHFKAISNDSLQSTHPFMQVLFSSLKEGILPHPKKDISNFLIRSVYIWAGTYIIDYLGEFDSTHLWDNKKQSGVTFHGDILDRLIFSYQFAHKTGERPYLISKESYKKNKQNSVHVKTDLIATAHPNEFGNLAICAIPNDDIRNISFTPPKLIWRPIRGIDIEKIKFRLTDERGRLLNYSDGHAEMTLLFSPTNLITF